MIGPARRWEERRKLAAEAMPRVRLDRCELTHGKADEWVVVIEGFGLHPAITPPLVTVGGVVLEQTRFAHDGLRVTGVLPERPGDNRVVVDLGYARAEGELSA